MSEIVLQTRVEGESNPEKWDSIDSETQEYLIKWYNRRECDLTFHAMTILADLYHEGNITFGMCIECNERCYQATPDSWDEFQLTGVSMIDGLYQGIDGVYCGDCYGEIASKAKAVGLI